MLLIKYILYNFYLIGQGLKYIITKSFLELDCMLEMSEKIIILELMNVINKWRKFKYSELVTILKLIKNSDSFQ